MTQCITTADIHVQCVSQVVAVFNYIEYIYIAKKIQAMVGYTGHVSILFNPRIESNKVESIKHKHIKINAHIL